MSHIWIFGEDVNTDQIVPGRFAPYMTSEAELRKFPFIEARPDFAKLVEPGDVIIAGPNFGCGSSREYAAQALAMCELGAIFAPSFARIFFRNALNLGLPLIEVPAAELTPLASASDGPGGIEVELNMQDSQLLHPTGFITFAPPAPFAQAIWNAGGLVPYFREHGNFPGEASA